MAKSVQPWPLIKRGKVVFTATTAFVSRCLDFPGKIYESYSRSQIQEMLAQERYKKKSQKVAFRIWLAWQNMQRLQVCTLIMSCQDWEQGAARQAGEIFDSDFILGHPVKEKEILLQWKLRYKSSTSTSRELSSSIFHCDSVGLSLVREVLPSTNNWCPLLT